MKGTQATTPSNRHPPRPGRRCVRHLGRALAVVDKMRNLEPIFWRRKNRNARQTRQGRHTSLRSASRSLGAGAARPVGATGVRLLGAGEARLPRAEFPVFTISAMLEFSNVYYLSEFLIRAVGFMVLHLFTTPKFG